MDKPWSMPSDYGGHVETLEPGDWLFYYDSNPHRRVWGQIQRATPTATDLHPCAMDITILWEGETKPKHYRYGSDRYGLHWAGKHRPICEHCGGSWPCESVRMQREFRAELVEQSRRCVVCGKTGGGTMTIRRETPDGVVMMPYHTAKSRKRCRAELVRVASENELRILRSYS